MNTLDSFTIFKNRYANDIESYLRNSIHSNFSDARSILTDALAHSLLNGGKRIRPLLTIATDSLFTKKYSDILPLACSFEIIHTYSLIHDDLPSMDNDDLRRGKPTCHIKYGEDIAILAGDTLNTLAFEILSSKLNHFSPDKILTTIAMISSKLGISGLVGGQVLDICSSKMDRTLSNLKKLHYQKTGTLIELTIVTPAILRGASPEVIQILTKFAKHLGLLFQIIDDILDVTGTKNSLGKSPGKDNLLNKLTYPSLLTLPKAIERASKEKQCSLDCLTDLEKNYHFDSSHLTSIVEFIANRKH